MNGCWLTPDKSIDRNYFDRVPVKINTRMNVEVAGRLTVESVNADGQIILAVHYNASPFPNTVADEVFYLTQEQFDELMEKGAACILSAPKKDSN